jgi:hypothetical protein
VYASEAQVGLLQGPWQRQTITYYPRDKVHMQVVNCLRRRITLAGDEV